LEDATGRVHLVVDNFFGEVPYYLRRLDAGDTWEPGWRLWEDGPALGSFDLFAHGDTVAMPLTASSSFRRLLSSDGGATWSDWGYPYWPGITCASDRVKDTIYTAAGSDDLRTRIYYSPDNGARWRDELPLLEMAGFEALAVTPGELHVLNGWNQREVYYSRFAFSDSAWSDTVVLSGNWYRNSFWPIIRSRGDQDLVAMWLDYEYSPYPWTGDLLYRLSSDGGRTWGEIRQATESHLVNEKDLTVRRDSLFLVYDEIVFEDDPPPKRSSSASRPTAVGPGRNQSGCLSGRTSPPTRKWP
jgi:hypothetical protein